MMIRSWFKVILALMVSLAFTGVQAHADSCDVACAAAVESGFTEADAGGTTVQCCCMPDANGTIVSQPVEVCQVPVE